MMLRTKLRNVIVKKDIGLYFPELVNYIQIIYESQNNKCFDGCDY